MSDIKPIQINPELFKLYNNKNKTFKNRSTNDIKPKLLKKDLLARIKTHRTNRQHNLEQVNNGNDNENNKPIYKFDSSTQNRNDNMIKNTETVHPKITLKNETTVKQKIMESDDDFMQSINFLKSLSNKKNNSIKNPNDYPLEKTDNNTLGNQSPNYGCLPTFREYHNKTIKKSDDENINTINLSSNLSSNKKTVCFKYNLGKKHKVVSVLIKNNNTRKKISSEHQKLKETKLNDMKNYLKRHNLLKSGSNAPSDVIKKMYEQSLLSGDIRNINKKSIVHNYLAE